MGGRRFLNRWGLPMFTFVCGYYLNKFISYEESPWDDQSIKKPTKDGDQPELLVYILSSPANLDKRNAIRETWLSGIASDIQGYFVIGTSGIAPQTRRRLDDEQEDYADLVLLDMQDSYDRLAEKVLRMMEHAESKFSNPALFMKCDDDTFVNTKLMKQEIRGKRYKNPLIYWGYFNGNAPIFKKGKWAEAEYKLCDRYIPYAMGGGYVIGWHVLKHIVSIGSMLELYKSEDVSLGTWLAGAKVTRIHDERFDTEYKTRGCLDNYLVTQNQSPADMREKWARISAGKPLCNQETVLRKSYAYNWEAPPSKCCVS